MTYSPIDADPLSLPPNFNPETNLLTHVTEYGTFHQSRQGAALALRLVANGTEQDLALAHKVLEATLACQETDPADPHYGNFYWMAEDEMVFDLNAVEFNLEYLIPLMIQFADRLSAAMQQAVLQAIRLGLDEIRRLDVLVAYTNITVLDILNTCLGGELLNETAIAQRGYQKLVDWMAFTDQFGHPFEFNSPTYIAVTLRALKQLSDLVQDNATRIRAKTIAARLGLSVALHIHPKTGRWAGPHSRAYHSSVVGETPPEIELLHTWANIGVIPAWVPDAVTERPAAGMTVRETAYPERNYDLTTYHSDTYSLGVAASEFGGQSNVLLAQFLRPAADRPGVLYSRYLLNDKWLGDSYHPTDRTQSRNLLDEGRFFGVQRGPCAIGLYAPADLGLCTSAKACLIWTGRDQVDEIWVDDSPVTALPAVVSPGQVVVIGSGTVWFAIRPLSLTALGREAPIQLVERAGDLVLEFYNYRGPEKHFWEMNWPGAFYKGQPQCGFYLEMAERSAYPDGRAFAQTVAAGDLIDEVATPFTYAGQGERNWRVAYTRGDQSLGLEVDLMQWQLKRRWTEQGDLDWPMLESPIARQTRSGRIELGEATLTCGPEAAWLFANPTARRWVAGYHGQTPAPLRLAVPGDTVELAAMGTGTVIWDNGVVTIEGLGVRKED